MEEKDKWFIVCQTSADFHLSFAICRQNSLTILYKWVIVFIYFPHLSYKKSFSDVNVHRNNEGTIPGDNTIN